ncbi:hypothetical protein Acr_18g0005720 [Actinidia rufa]|uniref:Uncharacterized protein n=1 Tax=Actinidia rufa TaxID=165716 RepID=A0A7J0G6P8_9ERIC|nr:hypothetical protein Acr_18g0005720 [Actinidia rufa]
MSSHPGNAIVNKDIGLSMEHSLPGVCSYIYLGRLAASFPFNPRGHALVPSLKISCGSAIATLVCWETIVNILCELVFEFN